MDIKTIILQIINRGYETEIVEFKEAKNQFDFNKLGKYFSALSNEANLHNKKKAWLIFGIRDTDKTFINTNFRRNQKNLHGLKAEIANHTTNRITFIDIHEFTEQGNRIVAFEIPAAPQGFPVAWKGHYFGRDGAELQALNIEEIERIRTQASQSDWSAQIIPEASIEDLDEKAISVAREKFKEKSSKAKYINEIDNWDIQTFLDKAKITINGKITNTAILLLGKEESTHYLLPSVAEITWKLETEEKAYEHFTCPLLLNTSKILQNIRNIKFKFFPDNELLSTTVDKYDTRTILEALHNCIAHQNYSLNSRIIVTEKIDRLIFFNAGNFYEGKPEDYIAGEKTPEKYRNPWLVNAMVNLGMIDTMGYGIHTMYLSQKKRFFPLPDYLLTETQKVVLQIYGHSIDENYSKLLIERKDLPLSSVFLLDRVQKNLSISKDAAALLRKEKLIEGRYPNYFVSASVAEVTGDKASYIKNKAFDKTYYKDLIIKFIKRYKKASREDIDALLMGKLSDALNDKQKRTKIRNLLYEMSKKDQSIFNNSKSTNKPEWKLR